MKKEIPFLFRDLEEEEFHQLKECVPIRCCSYEKGEQIFHAGDRTREMGVVMKGIVHIENVDLWGNKSILSEAAEGEIFAESYALCREPMMVDVVAAEQSEIEFWDLKPLFEKENAEKSWHIKWTSSLLKAAAQKNLTLSNRIFCTTAKTIRSRLLTYLSAMSVKSGSTVFQIPFNRQQMADYLNVDRSALSKELGKMRKDGLLEFRKNKFRLNL